MEYTLKRRESGDVGYGPVCLPVWQEGTNKLYDTPVLEVVSLVASASVSKLELEGKWKPRNQCDS